jgi:hypothetical protein
MDIGNIHEIISCSVRLLCQRPIFFVRPHVTSLDALNTCTGRFIIFAVITNIYNKKTKGPTLMELFIATGKNFFFSFDN